MPHSSSEPVCRDAGVIIVTLTITLVVSMFGVPALIAIFLLGSRWAIAGFLEPTEPN
jgi:hypothetical protein